MIEFFNSNFFQTIMTLIVGLLAFLLYRKQQNDRKKAAANALYLEIQNIESNITKVREALSRESLAGLDITLVRTNEWLKSSHLFSEDFDNDEWQSVSDFYHHAQLIDNAIDESSKAFLDDVANIRRNKQKFFAVLAKEALDSNATDRSVDKILESLRVVQNIFDKFYMNNQSDLSYTPVKYQSDASRSIQEMNKISITTIGTKLKRIKSHGRLKRFHIGREL